MIPPVLLKSARQQGVVRLPAALHAVCIGTKRVFEPVHAAGSVTPHVTPRQHAPVVIGHGLGKHPTPSPRNVFGDVHSARVVTEHVPAGVQHAPVGCGHIAVAHAVPPPRKVPEQSCCRTTEHVPSLMQHAPFTAGGHGFTGVQGSSVSHCAKPVQFCRSVTVQPPVVRLQHAPVRGCGHGFGVHEPPLDHMPGSEHATCDVSVHVPMSEQHVPCGGGGQGFVGVHDPPSVHALFTPVQLGCSTNVHAPVNALQHVPSAGCGHGFGVHDPPSVQVFAAPTHSTCAVNAHPPVVAWQHVPCGGCGHGFGEHAPPSVQVAPAPTHCC